MCEIERYFEIRYVRPRLFAFFLAIAGLAPATSDVLSYEKAFVNEVAEFARHNRLHISRLHRDVHADCYIPVTIATTILKDGAVKDIYIVSSSSVPVVDKYYRFVIEQAAPYPRLEDHFDPAPVDVTITHEFRMDVRLRSDGLHSDRPCERLQPLDPDER